MTNIFTSAIGKYETVGAIENADCIIGHSFGTITDKNSVNAEIARYILGLNPLPTLVDRTLANAFPAYPDGIEQIAAIAEGPVSNTVGQGVGAWGALQEAQEYMSAHNLSKPILVAHACMVGRLAAQTRHRSFTMEAIVPPDLPRNFEPKSEQLWTRTQALWVPREVIGSVVLRMQGKL